jgi:hypothetical protein
MAQTISLWTDKGLDDVLTGTYNLEGSTLKAVLIKSSWAPTDDGTAKDTEVMTTLASYVCDATGCDSTFGASGRKTLANKNVQHNASHSVYLTADSLTWTAIGGATNNTLGFVAIVRENTNDAGTSVVAILKFASDVTTNGGDVTINWDATYGIGRINNSGA